MLTGRRDVIRDVGWQFGANNVGDDPATATDHGKLSGLGGATHRCFDVSLHRGWEPISRTVDLRTTLLTDAWLRQASGRSRLQDGSRDRTVGENVGGLGPLPPSARPEIVFHSSLPESPPAAHD